MVFEEERSKVFGFILNWEEDLVGKLSIGGFLKLMVFEILVEFLIGDWSLGDVRCGSGWDVWGLRFLL